MVQQRGAAYLAQFLANPAQFYSEARDGRLMPTLGLSTQEIADVIAFLDWMGHIDTNGWPPRPILVSGVAVRAMPGVAGVASAADPVQPGQGPVQWLWSVCELPLGGARGGAWWGHRWRALPRRPWRGYRTHNIRGRRARRRSIWKNPSSSPSVFIVPDGLYASPQRVSFMPDTLGKTLTPEEVKDLVAYLMTLQ